MAHHGWTRVYIVHPRAHYFLRNCRILDLLFLFSDHLNVACCTAAFLLAGRKSSSKKQHANTRSCTKLAKPTKQGQTSPGWPLSRSSAKTPPRRKQLLQQQPRPKKGADRSLGDVRLPRMRAARLDAERRFCAQRGAMARSAWGCLWPLPPPFAISLYFFSPFTEWPLSQ